MPITYVDALRTLQQRSLEAMKVAQSTHVASLATARNLTATVGTAASPAAGARRALGTLGELTTSFTFALLDWQVAFAKEVSDVLTAPPTRAASTPLETNVPTAVADAAGLPAALVANAAADAIETAGTAVAAPLPNEAVVEVPVHVGAQAPPAAETAPDFALSEPPGAEPERAPVIERPSMIAGEPHDSELLSKTLPAPPPKPGQAAKSGGKSAKIPAVSNNRMPPKRGSGTK